MLVALGIREEEPNREEGGSSGPEGGTQEVAAGEGTGES